MTRIVLLSATAVLGIAVSIALCQPPGGPGMGGPGQQGRGFGFGPPRNPIMETLDLDKDGSLSDKEIEKAAESLMKLDKNEDGNVTADEMRSDMRGGRRGSGRQSERPRFGNDRQQGPPNDGMEEHPMGPPQGPGMGGPGMGGPGMRGPGMRGPGMRGPGMQGPGMQGPGMQGPGRGNRMDRPMGPPSPEQFVERAMRYDKDEDGKLSKDELLEMAKQFSGGPQGGEPRGNRGRPRNDQRPTRPRRPEGQ